MVVARRAERAGSEALVGTACRLLRVWKVRRTREVSPLFVLLTEKEEIPRN